MTKSTIDGALEATFRCRACNGVAAVVKYVPRGVTYPDPFLENIADESDWMVISGFLGEQGKSLGSRAALAPG